MNVVSKLAFNHKSAYVEVSYSDDAMFQINVAKLLNSDNIVLLRLIASQRVIYKT